MKLPKTGRKSALPPILPLLRWYTALAVVAVLSLAIPAAHAGHYELAKAWYTGIHSQTGAVHASDLPLCKAFVENLNSFPERKEPMVCERPLHPKSRDFSRPEWKALDPMQYVDLLMQDAALSPYSRYEKQKLSKDELLAWEKKARANIKKNIEQGELTLSVASLDLDGPASRPDGKSENVLRVEVGRCNPKKIVEYPSYKRGFHYYIVNDSLTEVAMEFAWSATGIAPFLYHGKVYFDGFTVSNMPDPDLSDAQRAAKAGVGEYEIYIYEPIERGVARVCRIRYVD